jgi:hypothetical protein
MLVQAILGLSHKRCEVEAAWAFDFAGIFLVIILVASEVRASV